MVEAKRLLADYILPERSGGSTKSSRAGQKNTVQCCGCRKKEHYLPKYTKASAKKKEEVLATLKSVYFKAAKTGDVNTAVEEEGEESDNDPPDDGDVD